MTRVGSQRRRKKDTPLFMFIAFIINKFNIVVLITGQKLLCPVQFLSLLVFMGLPNDKWAG